MIEFWNGELVEMPEEEEELVELKFRLYDGSDIGPFRYSLASTVAMLKERIVADWPKGLSALLFFNYFTHHFLFFSITKFRFYFTQANSFVYLFIYFSCLV